MALDFQTQEGLASLEPKGLFPLWVDSASPDCSPSLEAHRSPRDKSPPRKVHTCRSYCSSPRLSELLSADLDFGSSCWPRELFFLIWPTHASLQGLLWVQILLPATKPRAAFPVNVTSKVSLSACPG